MHALRRASRAIEAAFARHRWLHYVVVFALPMSFNLVDKLVALPSILNVYAADSERNSHNKAAGIFLGLLEDFVITALLVLALMVLEIVAKLLVRVTRGVHTSPVVRKVLNIVGHVIQFLFVFALCALTLAPFAADMLLMRTREMRFTTDLIVTYSREKDHASGVEIDPHEITLAKATIVGVALISLLFACVYVWWIDLTSWLLATTTTVHDDSARGFLEGTPHAKGFEPLGTSDLESGKPVKASTTVQSSTDDSTQEENTLIPTTHDDNSVEAASKPHKRFSMTKSFKKNGVFTLRARVLIVIGIVLGYVAIVAITSAIAHAASPLVAAIALNATLQELFRNWLNITFLRGTGSGEITSANYFLHAETEQYTLFRDDVLYRKTTGFKGDLAFDVDVDQKDLPNVLVIGMESHRYLDSLYLSNGTTAAEQMRKHNLTLTPNFDRWAKRGIAFNNMWSGWQTSRSLEAMQFGQINYDSVTDTGTTNGKADVKLSGLPQLFKQKGYKTAFTSGTDITYDQWHKFLPSHGFETALGEPEIKALAEKNYNITKEQWDTDRRAFQWGVHDDLSFAVLGDLVLDDIKEQQTRVKNGQAKTPFYRLHYTISSHVPFESYPTWFKDVKLPDFSPLTDGQKEAPFIQRYATLRYFADMQLGKFLDRMEKEGALKDMIIMMSGDHGISPEAGGSTMYDDQINCQHVAAALIAEGRLGKHAGMVFDDAAMQYDWVNTMADIIGVPAEGFLQTSIGRSLKRAVPWGKRLVWSNNPMKKFAVVRGHERFVYDRTSNEMGLYDTVTDPEEKNNLLPTKSAAERGTWESIRTAGRSLNLYFKTRWEKKCITDVSC